MPPFDQTPPAYLRFVLRRAWWRGLLFGFCVGYLLAEIVRRLANA